MLHGLSRCDQTGIQSLAVLKLFADLLALLNDCLNGLALNPLGLSARELEYPVEALHLLLCLFQVNSECASELFGLSRLRHFGKGFEDRLFGGVGVIE